MTIPNNFAKALSQIVSSLQDEGISWALTGSMGFALQGVPVTPNDIDLQTDSQCAYEIEKVFSEFVSRPVRPKSIDNMRIMLGCLKIENVQVDIIGGVQKRKPSGAYEPPVDIEDYKLFVEYQDMQVPVLNLVHEQKAYLKLGRFEKAALLADWLKEHDEG